MTVDDEHDAVEASADGDTVEASVDGDTEVDDEVQRRLREAYLNDAERELIVIGVRSAGEEVVVELRTPHGDATHAERFRAPQNGSLAESEAFLALLEAAGVSPLDVDGLVGACLPATYDPDEGWRLDRSSLPDDACETSDGGARGEESRPRSAWARLREWVWTYRYWLFAALLVGGELLFAAVIVAVYT